MIITSSETKNKKYKQRQKRSNGLYPLNYLEADWANTPKLTISARAICLPPSNGAIKWQEQAIRQLKPRIHLNNKRKHDLTV